jgi:hypothetical protein
MLPSPRDPERSPLPGPEGHTGMGFNLVLVAANTLLAVVDIPAPPAAAELMLLPHGAANLAGFEHFGYDMAGVGAPPLQRLTLFSDSGQVVFAEHRALPITFSLQPRGQCREENTGGQLSLLNRLLPIDCKDGGLETDSGLAEVLAA